MWFIFSRKQTNPSDRLKGFTLMEIIAVMAIIGVLVAALLPNIQTALDRSETTKQKTAITMINSAAQIYRLEHGHYPEGLKELIEEKLIPQADYGNILYDSSKGIATHGARTSFILPAQIHA